MINKSILLAAVLGLSCTASANQPDVSQFLELLPQYAQWAEHTDKKGQAKGAPLSQEELQLAKEIGVSHPEKVRVVYTDQVPYPLENKALKIMGERLGFIGENIVNNAQVFGYSIYVRHGYQLDRPRMAHELVHVKQIENAPSFYEFSKKYIADLAKYGYAQSPYEAEAFKANEKYKTAE